MQPTDSSKFTEQAWNAIVQSQEIAKQFQNQNLEVEHLILALLEQEGLASTILEKSNVEVELLKKTNRNIYPSSTKN